MINSEAVAKRVRNKCYPENLCTLKIDIDDFFMSGNHRELIRLSCLAVSSYWRPLYKAVLTVALQNQYLANDDDLYRVVVGSGMGMPYSGDLSDLVFYWGTERGLLDNKNFRAKTGTIDYMRFKDDILVLSAGGAEGRRGLLRALHARSGVWELKVEAIATDSVDFLDLTIRKTQHDCRKLETGVFTKPSALKRPLSIASSHAVRVHLAWPRGMAVRAAKLCSTEELLRTELDRLRSFLAPFGSSYSNAVLEDRRKFQHSDQTKWVSYVVLPYWRDLELAGNLRSFLHRQSLLFQD